MSKVVVEQVLEAIESANLVKNINSLDHSKTFREQGVDSLDFSGVLFNIEEAFDIEIPDEDIDKLQTVNAIVEYVNGKVII